MGLVLKRRMSRSWALGDTKRLRFLIDVINFGKIILNASNTEQLFINLNQFTLSALIFFSMVLLRTTSSFVIIVIFT